MGVGTILLIVVGAVLLIARIALLGGGMAMGGMMSISKGELQNGDRSCLRDAG
jgi:hypothetical protein